MSWFVKVLERERKKITSRALDVFTGEPEKYYGIHTIDVISSEISSTLGMLISWLKGASRTTIIEKWERVGRESSNHDYSLSEIPDIPGALKSAIWHVVCEECEQEKKRFTEVIDSVIEVDSLLNECWTAMVESYFSTRDVEFMKKSAKMEALISLARVLSTERDTEKVYSHIAEKLADICGLTRCTLLIIGRGGIPRPVASNYPDSVRVLKSVSAEKLKALLDVVSTGEVAVISKGTRLKPEINDVLKAYGALPLLVIPVRTADRTLGILLLDERKESEFSKERIELAKAAAEHAALVLEKNELLLEVDSRIRQMAAINVVAKSVSEELGLKEQLQTLLNMASTILKSSGGIIFLPEEMFSNLRVAASFGGVKASDEVALSRVAQWVFENGEAISVDRETAGERFDNLTLGHSACAASPLMVRDKPVGVMVVVRDEKEGTFDHTDLEVFSNFASQAAVAIENTQLYERLQNTYLGIIASLAAAIEARDPYTVGHSARVTKYAIAIAEAMGLSVEEVEEIRLAGLLHDLGKIGIPDQVLNKPGPLSEDEFMLIKTHPALSMRIIEPLPHLGNIMPIIYNHHERFNGSGYVEGKVGNDIPLGARIIAVADAFEAMTSDRPYRPALSKEEALSELRRGAGTQFDPGVVDVFLRLLKET